MYMHLWCCVYPLTINMLTLFTLEQKHTKVVFGASSIKTAKSPVRHVKISQWPKKVAAKRNDFYRYSFQTNPFWDKVALFSSLSRAWLMSWISLARLFPNLPLSNFGSRGLHKIMPKRLTLIKADTHRQFFKQKAQRTQAILNSLKLKLTDGATCTSYNLATKRRQLHR